MYWIILIIGALLLIGAFARPKPDTQQLSTGQRIGVGVFALILLLWGFSGIRPKPPAPTPQPAQTASEPATTQPATTTEVEASLPPAPTLPGLKWVDITLNLEKQPYGFKFNLERIDQITNEEQRCAKKIDPDTGADMRVCVYSAGDAVTFVEAMVTGLGANDTASWLIPYLATAPYEGSRPADAKDWARGALQRVRSGKPVERQINGIVFRVVGNPPTAYTLRIYPAARDKWLNAMMDKK